MRRRRVLATLAGTLGLATGCTSPFAEDVDLRVANAADRELAARITIGGRVTPENAVPPGGKTVTEVGRDEIYFDRRVAVGPGDVRWFRDVIELTDDNRPTGVEVAVEGGPSRRKPVHPGPTNEGTIVAVTLRTDGFDVTVEKR